MSSRFQETRWTQVEKSRGRDEAGRLALSELCAAYHRPVQAFVRNWCSQDQQAEDLTQDFFARLLARPALEVERGRGKFRSYLLGAVKHFLCEMQQAAQTQKRGGGRQFVGLDEAATHELADERTLPPDKLFDQQWACALLERALENLAGEMEALGKAGLLEALRPWLAGTAGHGDQLAVAGRLEISETAVRVQVHRLRKRYREFIEAELAQTLSPGVSLAEEMQCLFAALAGR